MIVNLFGLARDGKTKSNGMTDLLQAAIFVREVCDVLYFTKPPLVVQRLLFGALAASARALGYRGSCPSTAAVRNFRVAREPAHRPRQGW
jgi:hypothetical protein